MPEASSPRSRRSPCREGYLRPVVSTFSFLPWAPIPVEERSGKQKSDVAKATSVLISAPKVFTVLVNWNGAADTLECMASLDRMDYPGHETIVIDNGSTDDSVPLIRRSFPHCQLIERKRNTGFAAAANAGMRAAMEDDADYAWLLNNDTVVEADTLKHLVGTAEKDPRIGLISPVLLHYAEPDKVQFRGSRVEWKRYEIRMAQSKGQRDRLDRRAYTPVLWGTALLVPRRTFLEVGVLNEEYFAYHEDVDYCVRTERAGMECVLDQGARVYHKDSRSTGSRTAPLQVYLRTRNIYFFWMSHLRAGRPRYVVSYILGSARHAARLQASGLPDAAQACWRGVYAALTGKRGRPDRSLRIPGFIGVLLHPAVALYRALKQMRRDG